MEGPGIESSIFYEGGCVRPYAIRRDARPDVRRRRDSTDLQQDSRHADIMPRHTFPSSRIDPFRRPDPIIADHKGFCSRCVQFRGRSRWCLSYIVG